ncbi:MarR family transcriptional regulator [Cognaticolwellia beringensis]|uniref:MarR family transcriptional regulator n=2 Tax=Cognaticolwellia beringensis TaxID=1967665 RepID=A0A222GDA8_9GAMM|nr:MarR family transcriptional regulator [Cognaticolwellia beringensis]
MDEVDKKIEQWAIQMPELDTKPMAITSRVLRISKHMSDELTKSFRDYELTDAGFDVLATLLRVGPPHALSPNQLLEQMLITSGTMTSRIDLLERKKWVKRTVNKNDKRSVTVSLTPEGLSLIEKVIVEHTRSQKALVSCFSPAEQTQFETLLKRYLTQVGY